MYEIILNTVKKWAFVIYRHFARNEVTVNDKAQFISISATYNHLSICDHNRLARLWSFFYGFVEDILQMFKFSDYENRLQYLPGF
ncbi:hypothetical protein BGP_2174 [Beggiatoa sp. PS]|nr:hypothetical protein BGP_2174 [Beggiatoa sp. PS]